MRASGMPRRTVRKILEEARRGEVVSESPDLHGQWCSRDDLSDVRRDEVADELLGVVVDRAALLDGLLDRREVVAEGAVKRSVSTERRMKKS